MDITPFISSHREALLIGDYNVYRTQLSRQLLAVRKRLGRATAKREKFTKKDVTASDVGSNHEFVHLLLLTSERAWAHAMFMKTSHGEDTSGKGITGSTRSHIISRLSKAAKTARHLVELLAERSASKAKDQDVLEARGYHASLAGAEEFEKQSAGQKSTEQSSEESWKPCLRYFAEARVIYAALYERDKKEVYREILANTIDPTIRYAAYQAHLSRTIAIPTIAKRYFLTQDKELVDPYALKDKPIPKNDEDEQNAPRDVPNSVTWRGRKANIVDASIGQALAAVTAAGARLRAYLSSNYNASNRDKAAAYDEILTTSQDAADATKRATEELEKERVDEGDPRMQDLRVTSLAVNYDLVSWRVGRNRVLIGDNDGLTFTAQQPKKPKRPRKDGTPYAEKEEPRSRKLARLRERLVLYDATIQSIDSVKELRGAMRDASFVTELEGKAAHFRALKCLNISYSHSLLDGHLNALALLQRAKELLSSSPAASSEAETPDAPPTLHLSSADRENAQKHVCALLSRTHALVELHKLEANARVAAEKHMTSAFPIVQNLNAYPTPGVQVDLKNLVQYPPEVQPVPVKPLFLDVAWNYIEYPGREREASVKAAAPADEPMVNGTEAQPKKRGWFGFGR
ncbi:signal recognition particle subunit srp68 [Friedmanniomyces endolithicus]|uniref:Signal recognition particle subunit SRP68 n=1 Tax=Friedmanniomyces endolithicus TaxID=329885 RepID=A0AAN6R031_9PEZI|nr:signal recognition particle subunit srp68 [Friedmanniomyces endolithicus]KAK0815413.1 signal recognition particle subunit srp68 [Friedmanniomyces endolithicus]KAK0818201.1 signal recognition particle subunit srp68 [Friedmanniomyces endolithicus]KAK0819461.1 signal recognition particle subunit srp68 [Friedmanniomyces endolithicus]KAK0872491.1 signal recognition particle subunit srp68 [Friedmanniomyces endolithicus]